MSCQTAPKRIDINVNLNVQDLNYHDLETGNKVALKETMRRRSCGCLVLKLEMFES